MRRFEYKRINHVIGRINEDTWLNEKGKEGWELCAIGEFSSLSGAVTEYYFKRELSELGGQDVQTQKETSSD